VIHVLIASSLPLAIFFAAWAARGRRTSPRALLLLALACAASGLWAVTPDVPRLFGYLTYYNELHHRSYCNVWWFHCAIDARDAIDSSMVFPVLFVLAAAAVFTVAWRELAVRERERARAASAVGAPEA